MLSSDGIMQVTSPLTVIEGFIDPDGPTFDAAVAAEADAVGLGPDLVAPVGADLTPMLAAAACPVFGVLTVLPVAAVVITHRYLDMRREGLDIPEAATATLATTGAALVVSALTTDIGFAVLLLSSLIPFQQFGALLVVAVIGSALVSVLVLPSMLVLWDRFRTAA
ncbi:MAG: MMPL family transporter [Actinomycetota bacterium]